MGKFKNNTKVDAHPNEFCAHDIIKEDQEPVLSPEDREALRVEEAIVRTRLKKYNDKVRSNTRAFTPLTEPYQDYADSELIYIPLVFHQFSNNDPEWWYSTSNLPAGHTDSTYPEEFYIEVVDYLNAYLDGTNLPEIGNLGAHKFHPDHGVVSKLRFKIATHLPSTYVSNFLSTTPNHSFVEMGALNGETSFYHTNPAIEAAVASADAAVAVALIAKDAIYNAQIEAGKTEGEALTVLFQSDAYKAYSDAIYIQSLGGLMECGPNGAILTYNIDDLDSCKMALMHALEVEDSSLYPTACSDAACLDNLSDGGACKSEPTTPFGMVSGARKDYYGSLYKHAEEVGGMGNRIPVMNVWTTIGQLQQSTLWSGLGFQPGGTHNGNVYMDQSTRFEGSSSFYAEILLHELGHALGLPHTFQGGAVRSLKNKVVPAFKFPLVDHTYIEDAGASYLSAVTFGYSHSGCDENVRIISEVISDITIGDLFHTMGAYTPAGNGYSSGEEEDDSFAIPISKLIGFEGEGMSLLGSLDCILNGTPLLVTFSGAYYMNISMSTLEEMRALPHDFVVAPAGSEISFMPFHYGLRKYMRINWEEGDWATGDHMTIPINVTPQGSFVINIMYNKVYDDNMPYNLEFRVTLDGEEVIVGTTEGVGGGPWEDAISYSLDVANALPEVSLSGITDVSVYSSTAIGVQDFSVVGGSLNSIDVVIEEDHADLSVDEATFVNLFYSEILNSIDINSKAAFQRSFADGVILKNTASTAGNGNSFSDAEQSRRISLWEQTLNLPSFWGGSVDETQVNSQGNASLVFNKTITEEAYSDLESLEITNDLNTPETNFQFTSVTGVPAILVYSSSVEYQNQSYWDKIHIPVSTSVSPLGDVYLVIGFSHFERPIAVTQVFTYGGDTRQSYGVSDLNDDLELIIPIGDVSSIVISPNITPNPIEEYSIITSIKTTVTGSLIKTKTHVPFCHPNGDGSTSDVFDEFWHINFNWLDENYPVYPDNWPTDKAYNQFLDDGVTPLCPCLYATQSYTLYNSFRTNIPIEGSSFLKTIANMYEFTGYFYAGFWRSIFDTESMYEQSHMDFSNTRDVLANGHAPLFGYYGFSPYQGMPASFKLNFDADSEDFYIYDDLLSDTPRVITSGKTSYSELLTRVMLGSSAPEDDNYNPFKVDVADDITDPYLFSMDYLNEDNPFHGTQTSVGVVDVRFMHHAMNYNRYVQPIVDGEFTFSQEVMSAKRILYSPEGIFRVEAIYDGGRGKWGFIDRFSKLTDFKNSSSTSPDIQTALQEITDRVVAFEPDALFGCTDVDAINYNSTVTYNDGSCMFPGDDCLQDTLVIEICLDQNLLTCNTIVDENIINSFLPGEEFSELHYTLEHPYVENCVGGGIQYHINNAEKCVYGEWGVEGCLLVGDTTLEDIPAEALSLDCPGGARYTITSNTYTSGGMYFDGTGASYTGNYSFRSDNLAYSGSAHTSGVRLYTEKQLSVPKTSSDSLLALAKKFEKIRKNIENICKFVKL